MCPRSHESSTGPPSFKAAVHTASTDPKSQAKTPGAIMRQLMVDRKVNQFRAADTCNKWSDCGNGRYLEACQIKGEDAICAAVCGDGTRLNGRETFLSAIMLPDSNEAFWGVPRVIGQLSALIGRATNHSLVINPKSGLSTIRPIQLPSNIDIALYLIHIVN